MAPEQAAGRCHQTSPATDVHALGVVLYEMLTGRPPFQGPAVAETLTQIQEQEPVPPSRLQPGVPPDVERVCLRCLEKAPHDRYASAAQLACDLERCVEGLPPLHTRPEGLLRTLFMVFSRRRHITEYTPIAGFQVTLGFVIAGSQLAAGLLLRENGPEFLIWPLLFAWYVPLFWSFLVNRGRRGPAISPAERLMWATWLGHAAAFAVVCIGSRLTAPPGDPAAAVYASYPPLGALTALAFVVMGSTFWTRHYFFGAAWLLTALLMALAPTWAPVAVATVGGGTSLLIGLYLRRLTREPAT
jgi:hypothetical protein